MKTVKDKKFEFLTGNKVAVSIPDIEYDYIEDLAMKNYGDRRCVRSVLNCYAIIKLYRHMSRTNRFVPIHSDVFKSVGSANRYSEYLKFLRNNRLIEMKNPVQQEYERNGSRLIKTVTPRQYRISYMGCYGSRSMFFPEAKKHWSVSLELPAEIYSSLQKKCGQIEMYSYCPSKVESIFSANDRECQAVHLFSELVNGIAKGKINSSKVIRRHVREIASTRFKYSKSLKNNIDDIDRLLYNILNVVSETKDKKEIFKQIGETYLPGDRENETVTTVPQETDRNSRYSCYSELTVDAEGLDCCMTFRDLYAISHLNVIPVENKDGKLYSAFSRIRRPIRKFIRFRGEPLAEVTDVHSAHYTMLPLVFRYCDIIIPKDEMDRFKELTQKGDLYADAAKGTDVTRDSIKPIFQSFYSIKNEEQYMYEGYRKGEQRERRIVCEYFKSNFLSIYKAILNFHLTHQYTLKSVANRAESNIMNPLCDRLYAMGLHPFRLHDAIYMTSAEFEASKSMIDIDEEIFRKINEV